MLTRIKFPNWLNARYASVFKYLSLIKPAAILLSASLLTFSPNANAELKPYNGVGEYIMSDFETPDVAKQRAKLYAERNAQEQAGVYIKSYSRM